MPYWRLSSIYFFYFAVIGAVAPFWALYLYELTFSPLEIGILASVPLIIRIVMPNFWGRLADKSNKRVALLRLGAVGATVFSIGLIWSKSFWGIASFLAAYSFFWNAVLAQVETITLKSLAKRYAEYGRVRLWGSIGFICSVLILGAVFDYVSIGHLPAIISGTLFVVTLASFSLPTSLDGARSSFATAPFLPVLREKKVIAFFLVMFLLQVSHGTYYVFFSIYLESIHYERIEIGVFWMLGVIAEVLLFIFMHRLFARFSLSLLINVSLLFTAVRWLLIPFVAHSIWAMVGLQLLHALTFGVPHAVAIEFCRRHFGADMQSRGQAFYSSVSFGAGASLGAGLSGFSWEYGESFTFMLSSLIAFFAFIIGIRFLRKI